MMAAYGKVHGVPPIFYLQVALVYLPFVVIPALFGSWIILFLVRILARPGVKRPRFWSGGHSAAARLRLEAGRCDRGCEPAGGALL
jgi:hypothetical protein